MKKTLLTLFSLFLGGFIMAQEECADLFISEVIEGSGNNNHRRYQYLTFHSTLKTTQIL